MPAMHSGKIDMLLKDAAIFFALVNCNIAMQCCNIDVEVAWRNSILQCCVEILIATEERPVWQFTPARAVVTDCFS